MTMPYIGHQTASLEPSPGPHVTTDEPLTAFGGGAADKTPDLTGLQRAAVYLYQQQRQRALQVRVNDADNQATALRDRILYGTADHPEQGVLNRHGKDVFAAPDDALKQWQSGIAEITNSLSDADQKNAFAARAIAHGHELQTQILAHVSHEHEKFDTDTTNALVDSRVSDAVQAYDRPNVSELNLQKAVAAIRDYGKAYGKSDDEINDRVSKALSHGRLNVLREYYVNDRDLAGQQYLADHRKDFVGADLLEADQLARTGSSRGDAMRTGDLIMSSRYAPGLLTPGTINPTVPRVADAQSGPTAMRAIVTQDKDGHSVVIPTVSAQGKALSDEEALALYRRTGDHLGVFATPQAATAYANTLQARQARGLATGDFGPTMQEALNEAAQEQDPRTRELLEQRVRRMFEDRDAAQRADRQQAFDYFQKGVAQNPDLDDLRGKNPGAWEKLSITERDQLTRAEDKIRHPKITTDMPTYTHLMNLAGLSEQSRLEFEHMDLSQYRNKLSDADMKKLVGLQTTMLREHERKVETAEDASQKKQAADAAKAQKKQADLERAKAFVDSAMGRPHAAGGGKPAPPPSDPNSGRISENDLTPHQLDAARRNPKYKQYLEHMIGHPLDLNPPKKPVTALAPGGAMQPE